MTEESAADLERRANQLRARIASTASDLTENLRPRNLREEAIRSLKLRELTPQNLLGAVGREHPVTTVLCSLAAGYLLQAGVRRWHAPTIDNKPTEVPPQSRKEGAGSQIVEAAKDAFDQGVGKVREQVLEVGDTLARQATAQLSSALTRASASLERTVEQGIQRTGAPQEARDLAAGLLKLLLSAALKSGARVH